MAEGWPAILPGQYHFDIGSAVPYNILNTILSVHTKISINSQNIKNNAYMCPLGIGITVPFRRVNYNFGKEFREIFIL